MEQAPLHVGFLRRRLDLASRGAGGCPQGALVDAVLGEDDCLPFAVRGGGLPHLERLADRAVRVALAHPAHHSVRLNRDFEHRGPFWFYIGQASFFSFPVSCPLRFSTLGEFFSRAMVSCRRVSVRRTLRGAPSVPRCHVPRSAVRPCPPCAASITQRAHRPLIVVHNKEPLDCSEGSLV